MLYHIKSSKGLTSLYGQRFIDLNHLNMSFSDELDRFNIINFHCNVCLRLGMQIIYIFDDF